MKQNETMPAKIPKQKIKTKGKLQPSLRDKSSPHRGKRNRRRIQPCGRLFLTEILSLDKHIHPITETYNE